MKKIILGIGIFSVLTSSAQNKQEVEANLLGVVIDVTDQSLKQNSILIQQINDIKTKIAFLKMDFQSKRTAEQIEPVIYNVSHVSNKIDDYILSEINALIEFSEGKSGWFKKEENSQITSYNSFERLSNKNRHSLPTKMFTGDKESEADNRGKAFVNELSRYREQLILQCFAEVKEKNQVYKLTSDDLSNYDKLSKVLEQQKHTQKYEILNIYQLLTQPKLLIKNGVEVDWNDVKFKNQPIIGVIASLSSLRNDIRFAELHALKSLMERIDVPMMSINTVEAQVLPPLKPITVGDDLEAKIGMIGYDFTETYNVMYRYSKDGDYITSNNGSIILKADSPGLKYVEGKVLVEIAGILQERDWSYEYVVNE
jgi:hypothetical protein